MYHKVDIYRVINNNNLRIHPDIKSRDKPRPDQVNARSPSSNLRSSPNLTMEVTGDQFLERDNWDFFLHLHHHLTLGSLRGETTGYSIGSGKPIPTARRHHHSAASDPFPFTRRKTRTDEESSSDGRGHHHR
jgi:hypothetical protein